MTKRFVVSYDLRKPGQNYEPLWKRLAEWKAVRVLESVWIIRWDSTAEKIRDDLGKYIDANDGLLVAALTGESAWRSLRGNSAESLKNAVAA